MDDADFEQARYGAMRWNTPLSEEHAARLLARLEIGPAHSLLDLGCGWGELPLRAVAELDQWDEFEDAFRAGREEWRLAHAGDPRAAAVAAELAERLTENVDVYRGVLGFTYLVLSH